MLRYNYLLFIMCSFILVNTSFAMRCGDKLVYEGDNKLNVVAKCGEPNDKQIYEEVIPLYNEAGYQIGTNTNEVEQWIYQRSSADFQYTLTFDLGVLKKIDANRNP